MRLILASASPRRRQLLAQLGIKAHVQPAVIDERWLPPESPECYVLRLAQAKARQVAQLTAERPVLAADTAVVIDHQILGKPANAQEAAAMLQRLAGRWHQVLTGVVVIGSDVSQQTCVSTRVLLCPITPAEAAAYWASGEPSDKAGGYAIQGLGAVFVERIEGSYSNVVGLPLFETARLLHFSHKHLVLL